MSTEGIEEWKPISDWPSYEISSFGRVRRGLKFISTFLVRGYPAFNVIDGSRRKGLRVHVQVAKCFCAPFSGSLVRHLDGNRLNALSTNLKWGNSLENEADKKLHGRALIGEKHHQSKLTSEQVLYIRSSSELGKDLALKFGVTDAAISDIRLNKTWTCLK